MGFYLLPGGSGKKHKKPGDSFLNITIEKFRRQSRSESSITSNAGPDRVHLYV
jgi:hypothetical protein